MKNILKIMALLTLVASVAPTYAATEQNCEQTACVTSEAQVDVNNLTQRVDGEKANIPAAWFYSWLHAQSVLIGAAGCLSASCLGFLALTGGAPIIRVLVPATLSPVLILPMVLTTVACKRFCNKKTLEKMGDITDDVGSMFGLMGSTILAGIAGYHMYSYMK